MALITKTIKVDDQKKFLIIDAYSDTPNIKDGTRVAAFRLFGSGIDYDNGDEIAIQLDGAKSIQIAYCRKIKGTTAIPLIEGTTDNPYGLSLRTDIIAVADTLEFFIVYNVES